MTLHITRLSAENYKRLKAVEITPEGNLVFIGGRNAQGKTSVLDAIWAALAGGEASRATRQPIRDGQDTAVVTLDLGEFIVTRRWTRDDAGTLTVETPPNADGLTQRFASPQKMLDALLGKRAFDPLEFTRQSAAEQVATLLATVTLPFDPAELARERQGLFEQRTDVNRLVKQLEAQLAPLSAPAGDLPEEEQSAADILREVEAAREHNAAVDRDEDARERARIEHDRAIQALVALEAQVEEARKRVDAMAADRASAALNPNERIDTTDLLARLDTVEATNRAIGEAREYRRIASTLAARRADAAQLTAAMEGIDKRKRDALAEVAFPVPGLSFDDTGVLFNGIPFSQASAAERWRVSAALTMATHPELRVMQIRDGSLLDSDSLQVLHDLATEHDFQVFVEVVDESGQVGVVIEDGMVKDVNL